ncbi:hypothetical protein ILUMI_06274 [Ignelater luminosus]|uniref:A-kinase anchor protein 2 C-terminal domain-containing protein n=1 Tax=Ignelater luminosus TaxID=2038154 RepID=A0A8K0GCR2_IGNLU|nr:hypothetical protein ILUMI_06274 [Ignelater luminosus]
MPTTEDATLQLIQREISEVVQRENELRASYSRSESENGISTSNGSDANNISKPPLDRTTSTPAFTNGHSSSVSTGRLFTQNPTTKGVMQRFIKSRGKLSTMSTTTNKSQPAPNSWINNQDFIEPLKPMVPAGMQPRNGFVPVEERIRKEIQETQKRESDLRIERQKSQPNLLALLELHSPEPERSLRSARSISQLSDFDSYEESTSAPASLKAARSLAELCDVDEETQPPGSLTLIKQWENIIQKNQQPRT